jgi:hypothetical protein
VNNNPSIRVIGGMNCGFQFAIKLIVSLTNSIIENPENKGNVDLLNSSLTDMLLMLKNVETGAMYDTNLQAIMIDANFDEARESLREIIESEKVPEIT